MYNHQVRTAIHDLESNKAQLELEVMFLMKNRECLSKMGLTTGQVDQILEAQEWDVVSVASLWDKASLVDADDDLAPTEKDPEEDEDLKEFFARLFPPALTGVSA